MKGNLPKVSASRQVSGSQWTRIRNALGCFSTCRRLILNVTLITSVTQPRRPMFAPILGGHPETVKGIPQQNATGFGGKGI